MSTTLAKKTNNKIIVKAKKPTHFYVQVLSRHPTTDQIRKKVLIKGIKVIYRHGSTTNVKNIEYEINSADSVKTSADKLLMKQAFDKAEVKHALWFYLRDIDSKKDEWQKFLKKVNFAKDNNYLIAKQRWGSRGTGNYLLKTQADLDNFLKNRKNTLGNYIIEEYKKYSVEYRIHATEDGYFYACRKMLESDTPKDQRWQRHDDNCKWYVEENPSFNKPANWDEIVKDCQRVVKTMDADVLAFDIKCSSIKDSKDKKCNYIIIETCSAPSFGERTAKEYIKELPKIIKRKYNV